MGFRNQPYAFDSPDAAIAGMIAELARSRDSAPPASEDLELSQTVGRVLAQRVVCDRESPPFDHSSMDGYAVRIRDLTPALAIDNGSESLTIAIVGESRIGRTPPRIADLSADTQAQPRAIRIATGAPIPHNADTVIKREETIEHARGADTETITSITVSKASVRRLRPGINIRAKGENAAKGATILSPGQLITPAAVGALASVGLHRVRVFSPVRLAVITTGDEVVPIDAQPEPFQIRNSNAAAVMALFSSCRWINPQSCVHVRDSHAELKARLEEALTLADAIILTGGVSMGHRDPVRSVVESARARIVFHGLPQRPGKPMLGAAISHAQKPAIPIFALPGNPNSTLVTCTRIARPVLAACAGLSTPHPSALVTPTNPDNQTLDLYWHRLARLTAPGRVEILDARSSGDIVTSAHSDGFVEQPPSSTAANPGVLRFFPWSFGQ